MQLANPPLAALITKAIGDGWPADLEQLRKLEPLADDSGFQTEWRAVKRQAKVRLACPDFGNPHGGRGGPGRTLRRARPSGFTSISDNT